MLRPALALAQTTAVSGVIEDQAGGRLPGVSIELLQTVYRLRAQNRLNFGP
jgi:hypothetical protein